MKQRAGSAAQFIEYGLLLICLACFGYFSVAWLHTARAQSVALSLLSDQWDSGGNIQPDQSNWSVPRITQYDPRATDKPSVIAIVRVPAIDLEVVAFDGTSDAVLNAGIGRVPGTSVVGGDGNLALAGHRDGFFRGLKDIALGDVISVQHDAGVDEYTVSELNIVDPSDISVLADSTSPTLTLITCYPFYFVGSAPERFIVRAEKNTG